MRRTGHRGTLSAFHRVQKEVEQLQAAHDIHSDLDEEDDIDDLDLRGEPFEHVRSIRLSDDDINLAALGALTFSESRDFSSVFAAAIYRLYVQANFRTIRRFGSGPGNLRHLTKNDLDKLAKRLVPYGVFIPPPCLEKIATIISFWIQKKFKHQCRECEEAERRRAFKQGGAEIEEMYVDDGPVKDPLPPFVDLRVCEPNPLVLLRLETLNYFRKYRPTDDKYCSKCWDVLKREINAWADKL